MSIPAAVTSPATAPWRPVPTMIAVAAGVLLAVVVAAAVLLAHMRQVTLVNPRGWMAIRNIGAQDTDPITRAVIARFGLFANSSAEALYLQAQAGEPFSLRNILRGEPIRRLDGGRHHRIRIERPIPAEWWSLTLYAADDYLFPNAEGRYAWLSQELEGEPYPIVIDVAPERPAGARFWLPSPPEGPIGLTMRLYRPDVELVRNLERYPLPAVEAGEGR